MVGSGVAKRFAQSLVLLIVTTAAGAAFAATASARKLYVNVELVEQYWASTPGPQQWGSVGDVSAYYRTSSRQLTRGNGSLTIAPSAALGTFGAYLQAAPMDCTWSGITGGGHQIALLQDGTPFPGDLAVQWPDYPGMWDQTLKTGSSAGCGPAFASSPFEGIKVTWSVNGRKMTGAGTGGVHFIYAAAPRIRAVESGAASAAVTEIKMFSKQTYPDGEVYVVGAAGFIDVSSVPYSVKRDVLPPPVVPHRETDLTVLSVNALQKLGLKALPKAIPRGCVVTQKKRRHQRCP